MHKTVLHICPTYFSSDSVLGGAERYSLGLARAMSKRTMTTLVSFGRKPFETKDGALRFRVFRPLTHVDGSTLNPLAFGFLREVAAHDIVHCHQIHTVLTELAVISGRLLGKRVFLTDHGGGGRVFFGRLGIWKWASGSLAVSKYALSRSARLGLSGKVIYGGIDIERFRPSETVKRDLNRIVSIGRLLPHKGFHHLISAVKSLGKTDMEVVVAGSLGNHEYLERLKALAQGSRVKFLVNPTDEEIVNLYRMARLAVFPSTRVGPDGEALNGEPELFGQAPLEAMACGTPTVVSDVGAYPEIVGDLAKENPLLIFRDADIARLGDALMGSLPPSDKFRDRVVKGFTWDHAVGRCLTAYQADSLCGY